MPGKGSGRGFRDQSRHRGRLLLLTVVYIVLAAAVSFGILFLLNGNAAAQAAKQAPQPTPTATPAPTPTPSPTQSFAYKITGVPADAKQTDFSYDGKYLAYSGVSGFVVVDTQANKMLKTIGDTGMVWWQFMDSRDIVLYLTLQGTSVTVNTYDIGRDVQAAQTSFKVPSGAKVKSAAFSSATNYLCVNIETDSDEVYTVDIMKDTARLTLQDVISNLVLMRRTEQVYYTNSKGTLYFGNKAVTEVGAGILLGSDGQDKVYFQSTADKSTIYVVAGGKQESKLQLSDLPDLVTFCSTYSGDMYAVFDGFLIDLSKDASAQIPFDKGLDFVGIGGRNVFLRNAAGEILAAPLPG